MIQPVAHHFDYAGVLMIRGRDAFQFLQGQLTCDLAKITPKKLQLSAHCNPKGRVISLFYITKWDDDYLLFMHHALLAQAKKNLQKYMVFFNCEMLDQSNEFSVQLAFETPTDTEHVFTRDDGTHFILYPKNLAKGVEDLHWHQKDLLKCYPSIYPQTSGLFLPHELNLYDLNAIDLKKGCFTGQEIIARLYYLSQAKKMLSIFAEESGVQPTLGADIHDKNKNSCGQVIDYYKENDETILLTCIDHRYINEVLYLEKNKPILKRDHA